jgi:hypothetical protein
MPRALVLLLKLDLPQFGYQRSYHQIATAVTPVPAIPRSEQLECRVRHRS